MMRRRRFSSVVSVPVLSLALAIALFICLCADFGSRSIERIRPFSFPDSAWWILPQGQPQAGACYRMDFEIEAATVTHGWVAICADSGFELLINGSPVGKWDLYRATRPFGSGLTEYGQKTYLEPTALGLNFPREYQWDDHANRKFPVFFDVTKYLRGGGHNSISVTTQARHARPAFILTGDLTLSNGKQIPLRSHSGWKATFSPQTLTRQEWVNSTISVEHWQDAKMINPVETRFYRVPAEGCFEQKFSGAWLPVRNGSDQFTCQWDIDKVEGEEWLRIISTEPYILKINNQTVRPLSGTKIHSGHGRWMIRSTGRRSLEVPPQLLDPDEAEEVYVGKGFLNPKHGRPSELDPITPDEGFDLGSDSSRAKEIGSLYKRSSEAFTERPSEADPMDEILSTRMPTSLSRQYRTPDYSGLMISPYLKKGANKIEVSLFSDRSTSDFYGPQAKRLAIDGSGIDRTTQWKSNGEVIVVGRGPLSQQLQLRYYQSSLPDSPSKLLFLPMVLVGLVVFTWLSKKFTRFANWLRRCQGPAGVYIFTLLSCLLLEITMKERSEAVFFEISGWWELIKFGLPLLLAVVLAMVPIRQNQAPKKTIESTKMIYIILLAVLCLAFVLRAHLAHLQPLDDDEYASVQASLSIDKKGVPELFDGIYYTRGPLYHYFTGLLVKIFGGNIVTLRMSSIIVGILTIVLSYNLCSRVMQNRRMGLAAAFLLAVHPFCIFTSHIARFYQQQQFFTVLVVFFFIRGFVYPAPLWKRYATVIAFGMATLSQEISLLLVVPLGLCFATMAVKQSWAKELKFVYVSCLVVACIGINMVIFQFLCLTRVEGLSPSVESTLKPHFWEPLNNFSLWLGYSRLHLYLGVFSIIGMVVAFKRRVLGVIAVSFFLIFGVLTTTILVTGLGFRYQYAYLPLFLVIAVYGIHAVCSYLSRGRGRLVQISLAAVFTGFAFLSYSPWKIVGSYNIKILPDSSGAVNFVKANLREGDKVAITEPHPHAALLEIGQSDYDIAQPILYDFVFRQKDGRLIDRNGGAESLGRMSTMQRVVAQHDRVWFIINREKIKNRSRNMRWEYPGARLDFFIRKNCPLVYQAYSWDVFLWDRAQGRFHGFRMEPEGFSD